MESCYWKLAYRDRDDVLEPIAGESILHAPANPVGLHLADITGQSFMRVELNGWRPVFYRVKSGGIGPTMTDAVVFGRVRDTENTVDATLWALINGQVVDCPQSLIRDGAIHHLAGIS